MNRVGPQPEYIFTAVPQTAVPHQVQAFTEGTLKKSRDGYERLAAVAKEGAQALEDVVRTAQEGAKEIGEKVVNNAHAQAAFDAAQAMARAKTIAEVARLQTDFLNQLIKIAGDQTQELFELSSKVSQRTLGSMSTVASRSLQRAGKPD